MWICFSRRIRGCTRSVVNPVRGFDGNAVHSPGVAQTSLLGTRVDGGVPPSRRRTAVRSLPEVRCKMAMTTVQIWQHPKQGTQHGDPAPGVDSKKKTGPVKISREQLGLALWRSHPTLGGRENLWLRSSLWWRPDGADGAAHLEGPHQAATLLAFHSASSWPKNAGASFSARQPGRSPVS